MTSMHQGGVSSALRMHRNGMSPRGSVSDPPTSATHHLLRICSFGVWIYTVRSVFPERHHRCFPTAQLPGDIEVSQDLCPLPSQLHLHIPSHSPHRGTGSFFTGSHKNTLPTSTSKYSYCYWCHYKGSWASFPGQLLITRKEGSVAISSGRSSHWHMLFLSKRNSSSMADAESPLMNFSCLLPNCLPLPHPALAGVVSWY